MMWKMMLACMLALVFIGLAGGGFTGSNWLLLGVGVVIFVLAHIVMMRSGHPEHDKTDSGAEDTPGSPDSDDKKSDIHVH